MRQLIISLFVVVFALTSCVFGHRIYWEDSQYAVVEIDSSGPNLSRKLDTGDWIERVGARVISVGSNEAYVVAVRDNALVDILEFYYIEIALDSSYAEPKAVVNGPFTAAEFLLEKRAKGLPEFEAVIDTDIELDVFNTLNQDL